MKGKLIKVIKLLICIVFMLLAIYLIYYHYTYQVERKVDNDETIIKEDENRKIINDLIDKYNNNEIVGLIEISNLLEVPIVQTEDNSFYLSHDLYKDSNTLGTPFLDYRNKSLNDKKIIIYGKKVEGYSNISNYQNENYFKNYPVIDLISEENKKSYKIFSCFVETEDFDYTNLNSYNGLTYFEHISKLKDKSNYDAEVEITSNSKILVLELDITGNDNIKKTIVLSAVELSKKDIKP